MVGGCLAFRCVVEDFEGVGGLIPGSVVIANFLRAEQAGYYTFYTLEKHGLLE